MTPKWLDSCALLLAHRFEVRFSLVYLSYQPERMLEISIYHDMAAGEDAKYSEAAG